MADSTSTPSTSNNASTVSHSSCFLRTVCLYDWWLIKAENDFEGKWLAIAGITSRKEKALRVFVSAAVTKRYDLFSLETADGIHIIIRGFINEQRTLENGFTPEIFNNFIFGFPPNWENYAADGFRNESTTAINLGSVVPENVSTIDPKILSDVVEKSVPTSSKSPEEASRDHEKPLAKDECHASKETKGGINVAHGSDSNRRRTRLRDIKVFQKKQPASGAPPKHPDEKQHSSSGALESCDGEGLKSPVPPTQSQSLGQGDTPSKQRIKILASAIDPDILSDGVDKSIPTSLESPEEASGNHEKPFSRDECHVFKEISGGVDVAHSSGGNRRSTRSRNIKIYQQKKRASRVPPKHPDKERHYSLGALENPDGEGVKSPVTSIQSQSLGQKNTQSKHLFKNLASAIDPEILSDGVEKSIPTSKSPEEVLGSHEKPFPEDECHASREMTTGVNVAHSSGSNKRRTRSHSIEACQQKKRASRIPPKRALQNPDREGLKSPLTPVQSQSLGQVNTPSEQLVKNKASTIDPDILSDGVEKSIPTSKSSGEALGGHEKPFPNDECHAPKEITGGVNVAHDSCSNRRSTRSRSIKVCQQKKRASRVPLKHPDKEQHSSSGALENLDGEGLKSPATPVQLQPLGQVNTPSEKLVKNKASTIDPDVLSDGVEKSIPTSKSPEEALGGHEKPFPDDECHALKEITGGVNVAHDSCSSRRSTRSRSIKVRRQKKRASRVPLKHPDKEQHSSSGALENLDGEGLKSPATPVQLQLLGQVNTPSEKLVKISASRVSKPLSGNSEGCSKKKKVTAKAATRKRKMTVSASAVKYPRQRDGSPLIEGGKEKISTVSPLSLSVRKSRSGRLLLPPLEFWRNQIPIYNADHEVTEIQEAASGFTV